MTKFKTLLLILGLLIFNITFAQTTFDIRLNQVGYLPNAQKIAVVVNSNAKNFTIKNADFSKTVYKGKLSKEIYYKSSEENIKYADFSSFTTPGKYVIEIKNMGVSVPFEIGNDVFIPLSKSTIKAFYFNRASIELEEKYAGKYARPLAHPDTSVIVLPSAASESRPAGTIISTPYGWYDAGDYNKYIVNSGITVFTLLSAYENYPDFYDTLSLNIPESNNNIPDILDEAYWNIRWMMTMQDPEDGGVYNKTTDAFFSGIIMPHESTAKRYVVAKGTAATLDFAAIMAMTARIYKDYYPEVAKEALIKAEQAWAWAKANPRDIFRNPKSQDGYPGVSTGGYGDRNFEDEFSWCAAELYITTKNDKYYNDINQDSIKNDIPGWGNVQTLGLLSLITHRKTLTSLADTSLAKQRLITLMDGYLNDSITPYLVHGENFFWGGNSAYVNIGVVFMQAYNITGDQNYFNQAVAEFDYLLGRNATTYCFVTGFGTKYPVDAHHRLSGADGVPGSIPGFLVGGANPQNAKGDCGEEAYPSLLPPKAYLDKVCSYSTNEIAINWNAPMVYLTGAIQSAYLNDFNRK